MNICQGNILHALLRNIMRVWSRTRTRTVDLFQNYEKGQKNNLLEICLTMILLQSLNGVK